MIPPTPKHLEKEERRIRMAALQSISFSTQIARDKEEIIQRTEAPQKIEGK